MRKNGFTLIELLAVIVILAIIALIATPIVLNIIEDTKENAQLRGAEFYLDAVEQAIMRKNMSSVGMFKPNICTVKEDGNLDCEGYADPIEVEVSGEVPEKGSIITIKDGKIDEITLKYGTDTIIKKDGKLVYEDTNSSLANKLYVNGDVVYFDVKTGKSCTNYHEDNSKTGYNGLEATKTTSNQTNCLKFYAFLDVDGSDRVNLLLDHNTTSTVAWNLTGSNVSGPKEIIEQLYSDTEGWKGTITPTNYTMDQKEQASGAYYTITYSEAPAGKTEAYKARLITAQEIAQITGADKENTLNWKEESSTSRYYFDSLTESQSTTCKYAITSGCNYGWLYDRTYQSCKYNGCLNNSDENGSGYWTSSSDAGTSSRVWPVISDASIGYAFAIYRDVHGVRPVITVLKSNL